MRKKRVSMIALLLAVGVGAAVVFVPWKTAVEGRLSGMLANQGFRDVKLNLSQIGWRSLTLSDVSLGGDSPLTLKNLLVDYSLEDVWRGKVQQLHFSGLNLTVAQHGDNWSFAGMDAKPDLETPPMRLPVSAEAIADIPVAKAQLSDSMLSVTGANWQAALPLNITWAKEPVPTIAYHADSLRYKGMAYEANTGKAMLDARLQDAQWHGNWSVADIVLKGVDAPLLQLGGTVSATADMLVVHGGAHSADKSYRGEFTLNYHLDDKLKSSLHVANIEMPLSGGVLSLDKAKIPLAGKEATTLNLTLTRVSIDNVLQGLTGKRATATGVMSGVVPLTIMPDGTLLFSNGQLSAEAPGTIVLADDAIPGDNAQVAFLREVLSNFHYSNLSLSIDSTTDGKLGALMSVTGANPDVFAGREVKLNVKLGGDVLGFIQQNLLTLSNPQQLLRQGNVQK